MNNIYLVIDRLNSCIPMFFLEEMWSDNKNIWKQFILHGFILLEVLVIRRRQFSTFREWNRFNSTSWQVASSILKNFLQVPPFFSKKTTVTEVKKIWICVLLGLATYEVSFLPKNKKKTNEVFFMWISCDSLLCVTLVVLF